MLVSVDEIDLRGKATSKPTLALIVAAEGDVLWEFASVIVSTSPSALTNLTPTTVELTCPRPDLPSDASLVPQHATEPAVALPISGVTSVCMPNGLRTSRIRIIVTEAPTVTVICSGSTLTWLKWLNRICVPSETKHAFKEWKLPPTRSGDR